MAVAVALSSASCWRRRTSSRRRASRRCSRLWPGAATASSTLRRSALKAAMARSWSATSSL
jgi:hypothetical protein